MPVSYREFAAVDNALRMSRDAGRLRVTYNDDMIEVFRRFEHDVEDMLATFGIGGRSGERPRSGSQPLLRFLLHDDQARTFTVEHYEHDTWQLVAEHVAARDLTRYVAHYA